MGITHYVPERETRAPHADDQPLHLCRSRFSRTMHITKQFELHEIEPIHLANESGTLTALYVIPPGLRMPLQASYPPLWLFATICAILSTIFFLAASMDWRAQGKRGRLAVSLALGIILAVATGQFAVGSYQQYVTMNTWTYTYRLEVSPNATAPETLILPVPGDSFLLGGLHLVSGQANWSFTDTPHGRGLYVQFVGAATIEAMYSEFPASGSRHNSTPTMMNSSTQYFLFLVWIFYSGAGLAHVEFQAGGFAIPQSESVRRGWRLYQALPPPVP